MMGIFDEGVKRIKLAHLGAVQAKPTKLAFKLCLCVERERERERKRERDVVLVGKQWYNTKTANNSEVGFYWSLVTTPMLWYAAC